MERAFDERDARSSVRSNQRRSDPPPERGGVHEEFVDFPRPCCIVNGPSHRTAGDEADHHAIYLRDQHRLLSGGVPKGLLPDLTPFPDRHRLDNVFGVVGLVPDLPGAHVDPRDRLHIGRLGESDDQLHPARRPRIPTGSSRYGRPSGGPVAAANRRAPTAPIGRRHPRDATPRPGSCTTAPPATPPLYPVMHLMGWVGRGPRCGRFVDSRPRLRARRNGNERGRSSAASARLLSEAT
jgi:hypothetical protein